MLNHEYNGSRWLQGEIGYDPELEECRGGIFGLNGSADFYGKSPAALHKEFRDSLKVFLDGCEGLGIGSMETDPIDSAV